MTKLEDEIKRPDFGLRLIIVWKVIKGLLMLGVGITALALAHSDLHGLGIDVVEWLGLDPASPRVTRALAKLVGLTPHQVIGAGIGAFGVSLLMFVEAWGLHARRIWAEWLTVIVTSSLIPLEIYRLAHYPSLGRALTLVANVAIVTYLLRHRWLFVPGRIGRWWKQRRSNTR